MSEPMVTIGLTTYNAAETVEHAISSALAQTWRPIEIVAVDDCSTDTTKKILSRVASCHPELRVFFNATNVGVGASRNRILEEARGEFIAFFDDDDESLSERIKLQLKRILAYESRFANSAPVVCHTARKRVYPDGLERFESSMGQIEDCRGPHGMAVAKRILLGTPLRMVTELVRRAARWRAYRPIDLLAGLIHGCAVAKTRISPSGWR